MPRSRTDANQKQSLTGCCRTRRPNLWMRAALPMAVSLFASSAHENVAYLAFVGQAPRLPGTECELESERLGRRSARPTTLFHTSGGWRSAATRQKFAARI